MHGRVEEQSCWTTPPSPLSQSLSPIDTSGWVPGEGQICRRIKLIYQMIEYDAKATLLEKMQKGAQPSSRHDTRMTWQSCSLGLHMWFSLIRQSVNGDFSMNNNCGAFPPTVLLPCKGHVIGNVSKMHRYQRAGDVEKQAAWHSSHHLWICSISSRRESSSRY